MRRPAARRLARAARLGLLVTGVVVAAASCLGACTASTLRAPAATPARPAALVQAGDSKTNCIYVGGGSVNPQLHAAELAVGITWNCLEVFVDADPTWGQWVDPWITHADSGVPAWVAAAPRRRTLIVSAELIPQSLSDNEHPLTWETPCDEGDFDGYARRFAAALVAAGEGYSVVRLGMEMNGGWEQDYMGQTRAEQRAWAACFAREAAAMRAVKGAHLLFDWNVNACTNRYPLAGFYPGNAAVDIIGVDQYDTDCSSPLGAPSPATWRQLYEEPLGLAEVTAFAVAHHKAMSVPEWGVSAASPGGGADPFYVRGMAAYVAGNEVAFQSYFDSASNGVLPLSNANPLVLAAYRAGFGPGGTVAAALMRTPVGTQPGSSGPGGR